MPRVDRRVRVARGRGRRRPSHRGDGGDRDKIEAWAFRATRPRRSACASPSRRWRRDWRGGRRTSGTCSKRASVPHSMRTSCVNRSKTWASSEALRQGRRITTTRRFAVSAARGARITRTDAVRVRVLETELACALDGVEAATAALAGVSIGESPPGDSSSTRAGDSSTPIRWEGARRTTRWRSGPSAAPRWGVGARHVTDRVGMSRVLRGVDKKKVSDRARELDKTLRTTGLAPMARRRGPTRGAR